MNIAQPVAIARHPYADGSYKKMLIDGKWIDAASGKRYETHNPATGELLATVAEGRCRGHQPRRRGSPPGFRRTVEQGQAV
jgi:hypothetical protein